MNKTYYVYVMSNFTKTTLYIGVTSNLKRRVFEHSNGNLKGFTRKYKLKYLMYYEMFHDVSLAIEREKALKGKNRKKKDDLIATMNPSWRDLSKDLF